MNIDEEIIYADEEEISYFESITGETFWLAKVVRIYYEYAYNLWVNYYG